MGRPSGTSRDDPLRHLRRPAVLPTAGRRSGTGVVLVRQARGDANRTAAGSPDVERYRVPSAVAGSFEPQVGGPYFSSAWYLSQGFGGFVDPGPPAEPSARPGGEVSFSVVPRPPGALGGEGTLARPRSGGGGSHGRVWSSVQGPASGLRMLKRTKASSGEGSSRAALGTWARAPKPPTTARRGPGAGFDAGNCVKEAPRMKLWSGVQAAAAQQGDMGSTQLCPRIRAPQRLAALHRSWLFLRHCSKETP